MDPASLLEQQHQTISELFKQVTQAGGAERFRAFGRLARVLTAHAMLEERHFYIAALHGETEDFLRASRDEHAQVRALIHELATVPVESPEFDARLVLLRAAVDAHVAEEETELLPQARRLLDDEAWSALGEELAAAVIELEKPGALPVLTPEQPAFAV